MDKVIAGVVQAANADVNLPADGTAMSWGSCNIGDEGKKCTQAAKTSYTKTSVELIDLPRYSMDFLWDVSQNTLEYSTSTF